MQTPKPCWSFHMNPLLNMSPHWTTKYFSVNKYWDINNIWRAGQQAVQGSRSYTGASSPSADNLLPPKAVVKYLSALNTRKFSSDIDLLPSEMCPAVCWFRVNYRLTGPPFVVLESGVRGLTSSTCHSRRFLLLTLNTLSKCSDSTPKQAACFHWEVLRWGGLDESRGKG